MAIASMFMQAGGAAGKGFAGYANAKTDKLKLYTDADASDINARLADLSASEATASGQKQKQSSQLRTAQLKSTQTANMAANGIDVHSGSANQILTTTDTMGEIDANTIESNAIKSAWGYQTKAVDYRNRANLERVQAKGINPGNEAFTSLLGGASQVADSWSKYKTEGAWS